MSKRRDKYLAKVQKTLVAKSTDNLKKILKHFITNEYDKHILLQEVRNISKKVKIDIIEKKSQKLLKLISTYYIKTLIDNKSLITIEDITTINTHINGWGQQSAISCIGDIRADAAEELLANGSKDTCENIIIEIDSIFVVKDALQFYGDNILQFISQNFFKAALNLYKKHNFHQHSPEMLSTIFYHAYTLSLKENNTNHLQKTIDTFKIDLNTLTINLDNKIFTPMSFLTEAPNTFKEKYIDLLTQYNLHPDGDIERQDFDQDISITPLMRASFANDKQAIKLLLAKGADINLLIESKGVISIKHTAFSCAIGSRDLKLIKLLIDMGADPTKTISKPEHINSSPINFITPEEKINESSTAENNGYFYKLRKIIEQYYIKKILSLLDIEQPEQEESKIPEELQGLQTKPQTKELLKQYIDFKKNPEVHTKEDSLAEQFELLLLEFCRKSSEGNLERIHEYVRINPELNSYALTSILNLEPGKQINVAGQVLMYQPKLLHKFFTLKKSLNNSEENQNEFNLEGVYEVSTNFQNKFYVAIAPELQNDERYTNLEKKILSTLENCSILTKNSKGKGGLKLHHSLAKLKLAQEDTSFSTQKKYIDKEGSVFVVLDRITTHKDVKRIEAKFSFIETIKINDFASEIWAKLPQDDLLIGAESAIDSVELAGEEVELPDELE